MYEILEPQVSEIVVAMPEESKGAKDDLRDAWARADELRTGRIRTRVYKAPKHMTALRSSAKFDLDGNLLVGNIQSKTALRLIQQWAVLHRGDLQANWARMKAGRTLERIAPLD